MERLAAYQFQGQINSPQRFLSAEDGETFEHAGADGDTGRGYAQNVVQVTRLDGLRLAKRLELVFQRLGLERVDGFQHPGDGPERVGGAGLAEPLVHGGWVVLRVTEEKSAVEQDVGK